MRDIRDNQEWKIAELERELDTYRELVSNLPFSIHFQNHNLGLEVIKSRGIVVPTVKPIEQKQKTSSIDLEISIEQDIPFEKIERFLIPIVDTIPHHIVLIDEFGHITLCNKKTAEDLGVDRDSIVGKHIRELLQLPDELIVTLETLHTKEPIINREVLDHNYGVINTRIFWDESGNIKRVLGSFLFLNMVKEAEKQTIAETCDSYVMHGGSVEEIQKKINEMKAIRESLGLPEFGEFGMAAYVICRDTEEEALDELSRITNVKEGSAYAGYKDFISKSQLEQTIELQDYSVSNRGLRPKLVGTPDQIADRILQYEEAGLTLLLLQCSPQYEEMERFAKDVMPLVEKKRAAKLLEM